MSLSKLQNGSDIRGVAVENSERPLSLTSQKVYAIARGFSRWLKEKRGNNIKISVGNDSRITADDFRETIIKALIIEGVNVIDCSLSTTPAMYMSTKIDNYEADGAIMITASHMPYYYNGLKFFTSESGLNKEDLAEIVEIADGLYDEEMNMSTVKIDSESVEKKNLLEDYSKLIREIIKRGTNDDKPFAGMKIIVDAGNGAGGFFASEVLEKLGANTEGSQFLNPDGMFPNHIPNPENDDAMDSIITAVKNNGADLGIIFDTDVDRAAIVSSKGDSINKNALIALISEIVLEENPGTYIVTDSITSKGLAEFITKKGGHHHRFKRGYRNVINEAIRLNEDGKETHLAIETSGHAAMKENYFLDDGSYLVSKILIKAANMKKDGEDITDLIKDLDEPLEEMEKRLDILEDNFKEYGQKIIDDLNSWAKEQKLWSIVKDNYEGIRVDCNGDDEKGWFLLRLSLHEPLIAINFESDVHGGANKIYSRLESFLKKYNLNI